MRIPVVLGAVALVLGTGSAGAGVTPKPFVGPAGGDLLTVRGGGFKAEERVTLRVVVRGGPTVTKVLRAGTRGSFRVRFASVSVGPCTSYSIRATGSLGSRAGYTMQPPPCGPAP